MADKQDKKIARQMKNVNDKLDNIDSKMGDIYRNTYSSRNTNKKELDRMKLSDIATMIGSKADVLDDRLDKYIKAKT